MNHSWNIKCKKEKDEVASEHLEKCLAQTQQLEDQLSRDHQDNVEAHTEKSNGLVEKLKESWAQKCESEKESVRDTDAAEFDVQKQALKDELKEKHQEKVDAAATRLKEQCATEKAEFK